MFSPPSLSNSKLLSISKISRLSNQLTRILLREKNLLFHGRFSLFAKSCGIATVEVPDFLGDSVVLGFNRSKQWPGPFGFRDNGQEGATVSLKSLENSGLIFYYVPEVLASFEGIKAFNQEEDIDGNR